MSLASRNRGFTLIELLVVIAIIGMLSSVVLASLNGARQKGRDARRLADLKQLQVALELYYSQNGSYPALTTVNTDQAGFATSLAGLISGGAISAIPADPLGGANEYYYKTTTGGTFYCLGALMETTPVPTSSCNTGASGLNSTAPAGTGTNAYSVGP
jgi:prepilin-type N-terminal cleavage/methylation domain-containing protein